ncbi:response regulator transcription factor [Gracilibacillus dipsosauri]|uniref:DNA-binding response regulator n=1 Tax=Gracilibacillus dipsosauri TaxID=178340 RepID=A0A317KUK2_9BACI|nr:response regulator transcription factor [Gracilibacillus dipsosauri]PWU66824.1 DNA-binding response regulator [Gracilibacillus dipsosauri]
MNKLYKVLIVDDEMLIRQGIINYIDWEKEGYQIIGEAANGEEALALLEKERPDIIITDIVMPEMDGIELVKIAKEKNPAVNIIILSSFENFDYVRTTFQHGIADYILKPKLNAKELIQTLNNITIGSKEPKQQEIQSIEEQLKKILQGYQPKLSKTQWKKSLPYNQFLLVSIILEQEDSLFKTSLLEEYTKKPDVAVYDISVNEKEFLLLYNFEKYELSSIKKSILHFKDKFMYTNHTWLIAAPFSSLENLQQCYQDHLGKLKHYLFYLPEKKYIIYDQLPHDHESELNFDLNQFIFLFKRKEFDDAFSYLTEHITILRKQYSRDVFEFKSWLENIIFNSIVLLGNMKYEITNLEESKYQYFARINEANDAEEAIAIFHEFLEKVKSIVHLDRDEQSPNMRMLLNYIDSHYAEHLTLKILADHFHFNPSYLSNYFSTHHEEGFSEYLSKVRIKKSMEILETSKVSIAMVSEMVGYSDPSYFCKVFKKSTGLSPSQYRRNSTARNRGSNDEKNSPYHSR